MRVSKEMKVSKEMEGFKMFKGFSLIPIVLLISSALIGLAQAQPGLVKIEEDEVSLIPEGFPAWRLANSLGSISADNDALDSSSAIDFSLVRMLDHNVGFEAALGYYPEFMSKETQDEVEMQVFKVGLAGYSQEINNFQFLFRAGYFSVQTDTTTSEEVTNGVENGFYWGFGTNYRLSPEWFLSAEYQRMLNILSTDFDGVLLGVERHIF